MKKILFIVALFVLVGCSTSVPINYVPAPTIKGNGQVFVAESVYQPFVNGEVKANEMQKAKGALGTIYAANDISDVVKKAFQRELVASGYDLNDLSDTKIKLAINKFLYDWIGFVEVDFYIDITYSVEKNGVEVMRYVSEEHQAAPKSMTSDSEAIKAALSSSFSNFFQEARNKKIL